MLKTDEIHDMYGEDNMLLELQFAATEACDEDSQIYREKKLLQEKFKNDKRSRFLWAYVKLLVYFNRTNNLKW